MPASRGFLLCLAVDRRSPLGGETIPSADLQSAAKTVGCIHVRSEITRTKQACLSYVDHYNAAATPS